MWWRVRAAELNPGFKETREACSEAVTGGECGKGKGGKGAREPAARQGGRGPQQLGRRAVLGKRGRGGRGS